MTIASLNRAGRRFPLRASLAVLCLSPTMLRPAGAQTTAGTTPLALLAGAGAPLAGLLKSGPPLPDAPSTVGLTAARPDNSLTDATSSSSSNFPLGMDVDWVPGVQSGTQNQNQNQTPGNTQNQQAPMQPNGEYRDVDANGNPIPVDRHQTRRIGGIIPNYRAVSGGAVPHPPGWKFNFTVATHQAFDYSGFIFLGITSISAEGLNEHPPFGKGVGGFWTYTWHGFLDKTDGTYIQAWLLPSLLHEDTRYYALGDQYSVKRRIIHVLDRQVITRSYSGSDTINIAGFGGKVLTQYISTFYYPASSATFSKLAEKFSFSVARDIGFTALREFYPDYLGYKARKQQRKATARAAVDINATSQPQVARPVAPVPPPQP